MFSIAREPARKNPLEGLYPPMKNPLEGLYPTQKQLSLKNPLEGLYPTRQPLKNPLEGLYPTQKQLLLKNPLEGLYPTRQPLKNPLEGLYPTQRTPAPAEAEIEAGLEETHLEEASIERPAEKGPTAIDAMKYLMKATVTKDNIRRLALGLVIGTIMGAIVTAATFYLAGAALPAASELAASAAWSFGSYLAASAGTKLTAAIASRKITALKKKLPPTILAEWSEKLGLPLTKDTTYQDLLETALNSGVTLSKGGPLGFLISSGLSVTAGVGTKFVKAGGLKTFRDLPGKVIDRLSDPKVDKVNLLDLAEEIAEEAEDELDDLEVSEGVVVPPTSNKPPTVDRATVGVLGKNKIMAVTAGLSTALVGLAISGVTGGLDASLLAMIGSQAINLAKEHSSASGIIANIVVSSGASKVAKIIGLTGDSKVKLKKLVGEYTRNKNPNIALKILTSLTKGQVYGAEGLKSKSKAELTKIAKERGIKVPKGADPKNLRKVILGAEARALADTEMMVQTMLTNAVVTTIGSTVAKHGLDSLTRMDPDIKVVDPVGGKVDPFDEAKVSDDLELLKYAFETDARVAADAAKIAQDAAALAAAAAAKAAAEKAAAEAAKLAERAQRAAGLAERAAAKAALTAADQAARAAAIEAAKNAARDRFNSRPPPPPVQFGPEIPNDIKAAAIRAKRALEETAKLLEQLGNIGMIIVPPDGPAIGLPTDDAMLDPRIQEALDQFGKIRPIANVIASKTAAQATAWGSTFLSGPVGAYVAVTQSINNWLGAAEFGKNAYKLTQLVQFIRGRQGPETILPEDLDYWLSFRAPDAAMAADMVGDYLRAPDVDLKQVLLNALRDQVIRGTDLERLYTDIGRQILWGEGATEGTGATEWVVRQIGSTFYHSIMG